MAENKTKQTEASVESYLAAITDEARQADCRVLAEMMSKATKSPAKMWGTGIVGFASRKGDISIYIVASFPGSDALFAKLGKHKRGKACTYVKRLSDIDLAVLDRILAGSVAERRRGQS